MASVQMFELSMNERCVHATYPIALVYSTAISPIIRSPNNHLETGKIENLSSLYIFLTHST